MLFSLTKLKENKEKKKKKVAAVELTVGFWNALGCFLFWQHTSKINNFLKGKKRGINEKERHCYYDNKLTDARYTDSIRCEHNRAHDVTRRFTRRLSVSLTQTAVSNRPLTPNEDPGNEPLPHYTLRKKGPE